MKKNIIMAAAVALALTACQQKTPAVTYDIEADTEALSHELDSLGNLGLSEEEEMQQYQQTLEKYYQRHLTDSMGLEVFSNLAAVIWDTKTLKAEYEKADTLIQNNKRVKHYIELAENKENTEVGCKYVDISGPDALTGEELSISKTLESGKMVLLDFWASWCGPCRRCIQNELPGVATEYADKLTILGIDVWERQRKDLDDIMPTLPITWPVIYTGDREQSPADFYGISSIPTLVLIAPDGTILARGHQIEDIKKAIK